MITKLTFSRLFNSGSRTIELPYPSFLELSDLQEQNKVFFCFHSLNTKIDIQDILGSLYGFFESDYDVFDVTIISENLQVTFKQAFCTRRKEYKDGKIFYYFEVETELKNYGSKRVPN